MPSCSLQTQYFNELFKVWVGREFILGEECAPHKINLGGSSGGYGGEVQSEHKKSKG